MNPVTQRYTFTSLSDLPETNSFCSSIVPTGQQIILMQDTGYPYDGWLKACPKLSLAEEKKFRQVDVVVFDVKKQ